jgi:hypothetical protein
MPGPKPPEVVLTSAKRRELEWLVSAQKADQALDRRARVLLAVMGTTTLGIAEDGCMWRLQVYCGVAGSC